MAEISIDDLLGYAEAQASDLSRLGLSGMPAVLTSYGIDDPRAVSDIMGAVANTTYRKIANHLHPDTRRSKADADADDNLIAINNAVKRINADVPAAIRQDALSPADRITTVSSEQLLGVNPVRKLHEQIKVQRAEKAELLYKMPYSVRFDAPTDKPRVFEVKLDTLNYLPDDLKSLLPSNGDEENRHQLALYTRLVIDGEQIRRQGPSYLASLNGINKATQNRVLRHQAKHAEFLEAGDVMLDKALSDFRIIGSYTRPAGGKYSAVTESSEAYMELALKSPKRNPNTAVDADPRDYQPIDMTGATIATPKEYSAGQSLLVGRMLSSGQLAVGPLGEYKLLTSS